MKLRPGSPHMAEQHDPGRVVKHQPAGGTGHPREHPRKEIVA